MQRVLNIFFLTSLLLGANNALLERKTVLKKIQKYPYLLAYVDEKYKDDEELVLLAIKQNGRTLEYASKSLQDNEAVVREAV